MPSCQWALAHPLLKQYHDTVWGKPCHDDRLLFEYLVLESFQAGLSWLTILKKQKAFEEAFDQFDIERVANYDENKVKSLMRDDQIVRHLKKIQNTITMAGVMLELQKTYGSVDAYIWHFTEGRIVDHQLTSEVDMPVSSALSKVISEDLKKRGCRFVGPVIIYSYLQAIGVINDHLVNCDYRA